MSLAALLYSSRISLGLAVVSAGSLCACGLDVTGELAGNGAGGGKSASSSSGMDTTPSTSGAGGGGGHSSSSGAGGSGGEGGGGGAGGALEGCGDGVLTSPEVCDDGNTLDGDACTADCACGLAEPDVTAFSGPEDHCYLFVNTKKPPLEALAYCNGRGFYGATITTENERTFVGGALSQTVWIGGTDFDLISQQWKWLNGEPWTIKPCSGSPPDCDNKIDFWNPSEPNGGLKEDCLELLGDSNKFNDYPCSDTRPFLCEKSP